VRVAIAADHGGFVLKQRALDVVRSLGHEPLDCGGTGDADDDYPDFVRAVGDAMTTGQADRGVLICGSGVGASFAACKIPGIRAAVCHDTYSAHQGVEHDDMNVLCLGGRIVGEELAAELIRAFLGARFTRLDRFLRRLRKVEEIEDEFRPPR
jgi:ribose 5-phosphate isomerase B